MEVGRCVRYVFGRKKLVVGERLVCSQLLLGVSGVADGVGGWRDYGIDPGEFSNFLMKTCERFVTAGKFDEKDPGRLLASSYYEIFENKAHILGGYKAPQCTMRRRSVLTNHLLLKRKKSPNIQLNVKTLHAYVSPAVCVVTDS